MVVNSVMEKEMESISSDPVPHIPFCKIRGRLIPAYDFLPRLRKLCLSLGFNHPIISKSGNLAPPSIPQASPHERADGPDRIIILSTVIPYEQEWGGYSGLPGQHFQESPGTGTEKTPSDFILPYLRQYRFAQAHIHLGCDSTGKFLITLPDFLVKDKEGGDGIAMKIMIEKIAEPDIHGQFQPHAESGTLLTFTLAPCFRQIMEENFPWSPGLFSPIGEHLGPELFYFARPPEEAHGGSPFSAMLLPMMPWIVAHKTPHLAATLVHLQTNFLRECKMFAATGPDDLRNLLCVAGLDIDMKGFRGRKEHYFVPWQACWKRHGYCYGNIYPLLQDDLFVALMNFNRMGSGAENSCEYL